MDLIGTRLGLAIAVVWWSLVSAATSFAHSAVSFGLLRFCLGIGEGVNWPGASKALAEFFPASADCSPALQVRYSPSCRRAGRSILLAPAFFIAAVVPLAATAFIVLLIRPGDLA